MRISVVCRSLTTLLVAMACLCTVTAKAQTEVRVGGTGVATALLEHMAQSYRAIRADASVRPILPPMGSSGSLRALAADAIDLAVVSLPPGQQASTLAPSAGMPIPWVSTPMVFTGRDLPPATKITLMQVADIYAGNTLKWPDGRWIRLITRTENEADTKILRAASPTMNEAVGSALKRLGLSVAENDQVNQQMLERTPGSFGLIALGQIKLRQSPLHPALLDGVAPTAANYRSGLYQLAKPLYIVLPKNPSKQALAFSAFLRSPETLRMLEQLDFYPISR